MFEQAGWQIIFLEFTTFCITNEVYYLSKLSIDKGLFVLLMTTVFAAKEMEMLKFSVR